MLHNSLIRPIIATAISTLAATALLGLLALVTVHELHAINASIDQRVLTDGKLNRRLMDAIDDLRIFQAEAIYALTPQEQKTETNEIALHESMSTESARLLSAGADAREERQIARTIIPLAATYVAQSGQLRTLLATNRKADAIHLFMRDMDRTYDTLNERLTAYDAFNDREGVMAVMHGMATHRQGKWLIWSTTGLAILALGAIYAFFLRAIWLPLLRMAEAGHKLVAGDMEAAVPDVNADNELGAMSRAMAMLKALRIASHRTDAEIDNRAAQPGLLAKVSRDMRGPINRIIGMTNLLLDTSLNADQRNMAEVVRISSEKLGAVADEVATVSQLIDLMDGTVGVIVKLGDGSTFWFELALPHSANRLIEPVPHPRALLNTAGAM